MKCYVSQAIGIIAYDQSNRRASVQIEVKLSFSHSRMAYGVRSPVGLRAEQQLVAALFLSLHLLINCNLQSIHGNLWCKLVLTQNSNAMLTFPVKYSALISFAALSIHCDTSRTIWIDWLCILFQAARRQFASKINTINVVRNYNHSKHSAHICHDRCASNSPIDLFRITNVAIRAYIRLKLEERERTISVDVRVRASCNLLILL